MEGFADKVALITGGSRGIGAATAKAFAANGAKVCLTYHSDKESAVRTQSEIRRRGGECLVLRARVENEKSVRWTVKKTLEKYGRIDILVNNAGIWREAEIGKMKEKEWDETIAINLKGTFLFCNEVARVMKRQKSGKIINISSTAGQRGEPYHSHYAASKGGVIAFTKSISAELAPHNINVNCVSPGWVDTDMTSAVLRFRSQRRSIDSAIPRGRVATPEDIVGAILFLASPAADHIVGASINVNGGSVLF